MSRDARSKRLDSAILEVGSVMAGWTTPFAFAHSPRLLTHPVPNAKKGKAFQSLEREP